MWNIYDHFGLFLVYLFLFFFKFSRRFISLFPFFFSYAQTFPGHVIMGQGYIILVETESNEFREENLGKMNICFMVSILLNDWFTLSHYTFTTVFQVDVMGFQKRTTLVKGGGDRGREKEFWRGFLWGQVVKGHDIPVRRERYSFSASSRVLQDSQNLTLYIMGHWDSARPIP